MRTNSVFQTFLLSLVFVTAASIGNAQTATYHLHKNASNTTTGANQLLTAGPNATTAAISSQNLKNVAAGEYIVKSFDTQTGTPNMAGVITANSTITFSVWMKKSSTSGVIYPRVKLFLNSTGGTLLGSVTGATALTSTLTQYTLNVNTGSAVTMTTTDRFFLWVGVNVATAPTTNTDAALNVEGTLNGNYDSGAGAASVMGTAGYLIGMNTNCKCRDWFSSGGAGTVGLSAGHEYGYPANQSESAGLGATAGAGGGLFWSNAPSYESLSGEFDTTIISTPFGVGFEIDTSGDTVIASLTYGKGWGAGVFHFKTNTPSWSTWDTKCYRHHPIVV